jgi:Aspartyl protease
MFKYLLLLPASLAMLVSLGAAQASTFQGGAMLKCSGLPCLDIHFAGGKSLRMLMDTGNANSLLDKAKAEQLGLRLDPAIGGDGKPIPNYAIATLKDCFAGDAPLGDLKVVVLDLKTDIAKGSVPAADGTLAYTAFPEKLLMLDYSHQKFGISPAAKDNAPCAGFCGEISHPTFGKQGPPMVVTSGFTVNGAPVSMQIDTLWTGTMLIYDTSVAKLGLSSAAASQSKRSFPFTDGGVQMLEANGINEGFGKGILKKNAPIYFATPEVHQPDGLFDGTVGDELFQGHVLLMNFATRQFSIS